MIGAGELLGREGPLSKHLPGFAPRAQQQEMADAIEAVIERYGMLVCEAGTGTGKTLAYLVPALRSGRKIVISTGTRNLQDQLFHRDLPLVREALKLSVRTALLKGRANYLCRHRLALAERDVAGLPPAQAADLARIRAWAARTRGGDRAEVAEVPEDAPVWRRVTSTVDNCLGQECPEFSDCHVLKARRAAIEADVVIVNHHLFFADMALRDEGFGELLPGADAVILDEAHQLPDVATRFFGFTLSSAQLHDLVRDLAVAYQTEAGDAPAVPAANAALDKAVRDLRLAFGVPARRLAWSAAQASPAAAQAVAGLRGALADLERCLAPLAERGKELSRCHRRVADFGEGIAQLSATEADGFVRWIELYSRGFSWHLSPLEVAEAFAERLGARRCAWIFCSATLAVDRSFKHFAGRLGLADQAERLWDSPFDYARQALGYLPPGLPEPRHPEFTRRVVEAVVPVLEASRGHAFFLFTSHQALRRAADLLAERVRFPLLVQGSAPRGELLRRFRATPNAVLLGTASFWEGVDVRGEALSCVIIEKLPFAAPDDPVLQARVAALRARGGDPFLELQLPQAVIALKQGCGRLIRDAADRGVLVLCDPRLHTKPYGRVFLDSLPPVRRTREIEDVRAFFAGTGAGAGAARAGAGCP